MQVPDALQIQLTWEDPTTGERRSPILQIPIALGRDFAQMPGQLQERRVSRIVLNSSEVSRFHALIDAESGGLVLIDQNSRNGTRVNGILQARSLLANGDTVQVGPYHISLSFSPSRTPAALPEQSTILFHPETDLPDPQLSPVSPEPIASAGSTFPPPLFQQQQISIPDLLDTGLPLQEFDYVTIGAGLGSFIWVDFLRISGVRQEQIAALGMEPLPYARYKRLCQNSQIPLQERLRSNSDSCPDNIWGWPSYALREAWQELRRGNVTASVKYLWQVFAEPTLAETYTPRSGNVFASLDREATRIGWDQIFRYARVRAIRQTADGRYVIACSRSDASRRDHFLVLARYLHLAIGYPAIQFLPDLQAYREKTGDFKSVVNAYEPHDHVYENLERQGGTVLIRGRGIVASRVLQRIHEARLRNPNISVLHLMRSPKPQGNKFGRARRQVENHYEFQPFNWPKACWTGELRVLLERASPEERQRLLADWGGTTTAARSDWRHIIQNGLNQGWYQITFGEVERVEQEQGQTLTYIREKGLKGQIHLAADFIIDATGLEAKVEASPLLQDLVTHYHLPLNYLGRLQVTNQFELPELRNDRGRVYATGAITLGGPQAAVDSFLGLQYAALWTMDALRSARAPGLKRLHALRSLGQWLKWALNHSP